MYDSILEKLQLKSYDLANLLLFQSTDFFTNAVRIEQDLTVAGTWCTLDAVQLTGVPGENPPPPPSNDIDQWVSNVIAFSSQYNDAGFVFLFLFL